MCILLAYMLPFIFCLPAYLIFSVNEKEVTENGVKEKIYVLDFSEFALRDNEFYFYVYFWVYFVIIKLFPCLLLTVITCWLIHTLKTANEKRDELQYNHYHDTLLCNSLSASRKKKLKRIDLSLIHI